MLSLLIFSGITLLLILEGSSIAYLILKIASPLLVLSLGLPIAALVNVLIVFLWTVTGIPLTPLSLIGAHAVVFVFLFLMGKNVIPIVSVTTEEPKASLLQKSLEFFCMALIGITAIYSFAHAVLLPTFQYDSATNWTMRSEISFYDHSIAFDKTEERGMAKPQYPFLFHSMQITANQGEAEWNDTAANTILWLLSFSSFIALFLILRNMLQRTAALLTITMILGIPLLSLHLGQGYGDIVLLQELLLSLACMLAWIRNKESKWLVLSAIFVASAVWTKSEGLIFGLIPWLLVVFGVVFMDRSQKKPVLQASLTAIALSIAWPLFALSRGLLLTPHGSDTLIGFHPEGVQEAMLGLFDRGSFGIAWYVLTVSVVWMLIGSRTASKSEKKELLPLLWGLIVFAEILFIYLATPNVQFLLNAQSYYRQMMIPAAMLMLSACVWFGRRVMLRDALADARAPQHDNAR